eukprot:4629170-Amphidinium_carterae.2
MELLEPSLIGLMKYVQSKAKGGDLTASTLLEECVAGLEISKEQSNPPPALRKMQTRTWSGKKSPRPRRPEAWGQVHLLPPRFRRSWPGQASAPAATPADGSAGEAASASSPAPAVAEASAVSEDRGGSGPSRWRCGLGICRQPAGVNRQATGQAHKALCHAPRGSADSVNRVYRHTA